MRYPWIKKMWQDAVDTRLEFIKKVSDIEVKYLRKHKLTKADVSFVWFDELLIGIAIDDAKGQRIVFEDDILREH